MLILGLGAWVLLESPCLDSNDKNLRKYFPDGGDLWRHVCSDDDCSEDSVCVLSINEVPLSPVSLVREPGYLNNSSEFISWIDAQKELYDQLKSKDPVEVLVHDTAGKDTVLLISQSSFSFSRNPIKIVSSLIIIFILFFVGSFTHYTTDRLNNIDLGVTSRKKHYCIKRRYINTFT